MKLILLVWIALTNTGSILTTTTTILRPKTKSKSAYLPQTKVNYPHKTDRKRTQRVSISLCSIHTRFYQDKIAEVSPSQQRSTCTSNARVTKKVVIQTD